MSVVDASIFVSAFNPKDAFHVVSRAWLLRQLRAGMLIQAPMLLQSEVGGALVRRTQDPALATRALRWIRALPKIQLGMIGEALGDLAGDLAIQLKLRGADAVYVALASQLSVPLYTWDDQQRKRAALVVDAREPS